MLVRIPLALPLALAAIVLGLLANASWGDAPVYTRDVAPILRARCEECHRPGTVAPMSFATYDEVRPWAKAIKRVVHDGSMPPWHADPKYGPYANDRTPTEAERATLLAWVDAGTPKGDPADAPPPLEFADGRTIEPDAVFEMPVEYEVPADVEDEYRYFSVPTNFAEDKWIEAVEVRPGNPDVVHHVIAFPVGGWAPGVAPRVFEPGYGILIPAGTTIRMQMHYHKEKGTAMKDRSAVAVRFARKPIVKQFRRAGIVSRNFEIPPGAAAHAVTASLTVPRDARLAGMMPHMHLRGKSMRYTALFPDGSERVLLDVPRYDFAWQTTYEPAEWVPLPKGTKIRVDATFDNSPNNPANPDPSVPVRWGQATTDEMMIGYVDYVFDEEDIPAGKLIPQARMGLAEAGAEGGLGRFLGRGRGGAGAGGGEGFGGGEGGGLERLIDFLDADGDGKLQRAELPAERGERFFDLLDADGDDALSAEEVREARERFGRGAAGGGPSGAIGGAPARGERLRRLRERFGGGD